MGLLLVLLVFLIAFSPPAAFPRPSCPFRRSPSFQQLPLVILRHLFAPPSRPSRLSCSQSSPPEALPACRSLSPPAAPSRPSLPSRRSSPPPASVLVLFALVLIQHLRLVLLFLLQQLPLVFFVRRLHRQSAK